MGLTHVGQLDDVAAVDSLCCDVSLTEEEEAVCKQVHGLLPAAAAERISLERIRKLHRQDKANSFLLPLPDESGTKDGGCEGGEAAGGAAAAVGLPNPRATGRAVAIYPRVLAMANHSCWPSAVRIDPCPQPSLACEAIESNASVTLAAALSYRALEPLSAGTEVTQSYVGIGWPQRPDEGEMSAEDQARFVPRNDYLQHEYGFRCTCTRCKLEESLPDSDAEQGSEDEANDEIDLKAEAAKELALEALQEQVRCRQSLHFDLPEYLSVVRGHVLPRTWSCSYG